MFDRLIDLVVQFIHLFQFWVVLDPFEEGVLVRLGTFVRVVEPGFHWRIPLNVDVIISTHVVPTTHTLGDESVTSADERSIGYHAVVTYRVSNVKKAMLEVSDVDHAVRDACSGEIRRVLSELTWVEMNQPDTLDRLSEVCRKRGWRYGIEVMSVQLAGLALCRSIRIMQR